MNCLTDLKKAFQASGKKVTSSFGYELIVDGNTYTLALDTFYKNGEPIAKKDLIALVKPKK